MAEYKDRIRVHIEGKEFSVVGGEFQDMLAAVKQINGRRFVGELKVWQLPGSAEDVQNQLDISGYWLEGGKPLDETALSTQTSPAGSGGDRIRVLIQGHQLAVVGGTFREMLDVVKSLPGRRYDGDNKVWEIPGEIGIIKGLIQAANFTLEGAEQIPVDTEPQAEPPNFTPKRDTAPPPFEEPDFTDDDDVPPYEPPDWWDDPNTPPPPEEPPDWWEEEMALRSPAEPPHFPDELPEVGSERPSPAPATGTPAFRGGDQIRIRVGGIPLVVTGGPFREMLEVVKKIPGRRFNSDEKLWDIPEDVAIDSVQQVVKTAGFVLEKG